MTDQKPIRRFIRIFFAVLAVAAFVAATFYVQLAIRKPEADVSAPGKPGAPHPAGRPAGSPDRRSPPGALLPGRPDPANAAAGAAPGAAPHSLLPRNSGGRHAPDPAATAGLSTGAPASATAGEPIGLASLAPGVTASESDMIFLCFALESGKLKLLSQSVVRGNMRLPGDVAPADGLYSRVLSSSGRILAQELLPDPRLVYYDYPIAEGADRLTGGKLLMSNVEFAVRYPLIPGMAAIELFSVTRTQELSTLSAGDTGFHGSFKLAIPER